jgi:hypothetical protein
MRIIVDVNSTFQDGFGKTDDGCERCTP